MENIEQTQEQTQNQQVVQQEKEQQKQVNIPQISLDNDQILKYKILSQLKSHSNKTKHKLQLFTFRVISSIPLDITEDNLKYFIESTVKVIQPEIEQLIEEVKIVNLNIDTKCSGDVQVDNINEKVAIISCFNKKAQEAIRKLDKVPIQNKNVTIKTLKGYTQARFLDFKKEKQIEKKNKKEIQLYMKQVDPQDRIFMGNLPLHLTEAEIREMIEVIGKLRSFQMIMDHKGKFRGFVFFEYLDSKNIEKAIKSFNNLDMGNKKLQCHRANPDKPDKKQNQNGNIQIGFSKERVDDWTLPILNQLTQDQILYIKKCFKPDPEFTTPSTVVILMNMYSYYHLQDANYMQQLYADVAQQCRNFGLIEEVFIPSGDPNASYVGKVFVNFQELKAAKKAKEGISGLVYIDKTVITSYFPLDLFKQKLLA